MPVLLHVNSHSISEQINAFLLSDIRWHQLRCRDKEREQGEKDKKEEEGEEMEEGGEEEEEEEEEVMVVT